MQKNIFEPSGKIGQKDFITNYILLLMTYILGGTLIFFLVNKYHLGITYIVLPLLLIKTLIAFNYKKRILDITEKLIPSIIWAIILTFDTELLTFCQTIKNVQLSIFLFVIFGIFIILIQPAIVALIPAQKTNNN